MTPIASDLIAKISSRSARTGVIGLGYVGLPLAVELGAVGFDVTSVDVVQAKVDAINRGESYIPDVPGARVRELVASGRFRATTDFAALGDVDTINICVPTPLRKTKDPDMSFVVAAVEQVAKYLRRGQLVILESTTYPGTTEELLKPRLEERGLVVGRDCFLAFSPERVDPGNERWHTGNIPKVVGGIDAESTEVAATLYRQINASVVPVSSAKVAEMVKLLENTFRAVNIGMVNELALMCRDLGVDVWEVIDAASTKPFGFMPFYPGPGLGGHCIPIDPFYLSWKAREFGFESRFIELAGHINGSMPRYVVERVADALNGVSKALRGSRVHLFGIAYKPDIDDVRESPALDVAKLLEAKGAGVSYSDPYVPRVDEHGLRLAAVPVEDAFRAGFDCAVITTNHKAFDYARIVADAPLIVDTRNALRGYKAPHIVRL